jgi:hypothetical protein
MREITKLVRVTRDGRKVDQSPLTCYRSYLPNIRYSVFSINSAEQGMQSEVKIWFTLYLQGVQLKSEPYFNISNLFTTCYITQLT